MKILINAVGVDMGGGMRHLRNFLPTLEQDAKVHQYLVVTRHQVAGLAGDGRVRVVALPNAARQPRRLVFDNVEIPLLMRRHSMDGVVSLANIGPIWTSKPHVVFQRNALYFCRAAMRELTGSVASISHLRRFAAVAAMKRASTIVTPSDSMREMILSEIPDLRNRRFRTLHHAFEIGRDTEPDPQQKEMWSSRVGAHLFYPAHLGRHKSFPTLFRAISSLKRSGVDATLFITAGREDAPGEFDREMAAAKLAGVDRDVIFLGRVEQDAMSWFYRRADVMVYASVCESYGFPLVEGLAYGAAIVASDTPVNRELGGDAALYFDPRSPEEAARLIEALVNGSGAANARARSSARACRFPGSWSSYVERFETIVSEAVGG